MSKCLAIKVLVNSMEKLIARNFLTLSFITINPPCDLARKVHATLHGRCMRPCYCHAWTGAPNCYLNMLDKLQKRVWRTLGPTLATSLEHLASLKPFFIGITLIDVNLKWVNSFHFLATLVGPLVILAGCIIFLSPSVDVRSMSMSSVSFLTQLDPGILC